MKIPPRNWQVGQKLLCISRPSASALQVGHIYTFSAWSDNPCNCPPFVHLQEILPPLNYKLPIGKKHKCKFCKQIFTLQPQHTGRRFFASRFIPWDENFTDYDEDSEVITEKIPTPQVV